MTILFAGFLLLGWLACLPAWLTSRTRTRGRESAWLPFATFPALAAWVLLAGFGYGPQSLSNLVEVPGLFAAGIILCYGKVFLLDRRVKDPRWTTYLLMALLVTGSILLRTFMPLLPE
jgi:hypothetical protein